MVIQISNTRHSCHKNSVAFYCLPVAGYCREYIRWVGVLTCDSPRLPRSFSPTHPPPPSPSPPLEAPTSLPTLWFSFGSAKRIVYVCVCVCAGCPVPRSGGFLKRKEVVTLTGSAPLLNCAQSARARFFASTPSSLI